VKFTWDPDKDKANKQKHGVTFLEACYVFADKFILTLYDDEHSGNEDRWVSIGQTPNNILVVVHTFQEIKGSEYVRIISARQANKSEIKQYIARRGKG
jgi:hypothetical protein